MTIIEPDYNWSGSLSPRNATEYVIMHHAAADGVSAEVIHGWHLSQGYKGIAYHYYVRKDGSVYRGRPENTQGGHTLGFNYHSIGICFEGNFENEIMPQVQLDAGRELLADIVSRYPKIEIKVHRDFNATACPGRNFPYDEMLKLKEEVEDNEPSDWAKESWDLCVEKGIFDGTNPKGNLTREQAAVVFDRMGLVK